MNRMRMGGGIAWIAIVLMAVVGAGCNSGGAFVTPAKSFVSPEWPGLKIETLAFVGLGAAGADPNTRAKAEDLLEQELRSTQTRFMVLPKAVASDRASKAGVTDALQKITRVWRDVRTVDQFVATDLCQKLGVDGLLFADLDAWQKERADLNSEGTSFSQVGYTLSIVSGKTGLLAWQASKTHREDSAVYRPGNDPLFQNDPNDVQRAGKATTITPDPPDIDAVARKTVGALFAAFPPPAAAGTR